MSVKKYKKLSRSEQITPANAEAKLNMMGKKYGCTEEGITWMKNCLDPFPDIKRKLEGYPDSIKTPSILQYFREELPVVVPASAGAGSWDCNIFHPGYYTSSTNVATAIVGNAQGAPVDISATQTTSYPAGTIEVRSGPAAANLTMAQTTAAMVPAVSLALENRIVALGFEVFNTTQELNINGALTSWRQEPVISRGTCSVHGAAGANPSANQYTWYTDAPNNSSTALNMEGSLEWDAKDGAYCVGVQSAPINPPKSATDGKLSNIASNGASYMDPLVLYGSTYAPSNVKNESNFDQFGVYLTGLSNQTTLKIVLHYVIERFPVYSNVDLITLAQPTCPYDPRALELYTLISGHLPTGCPVDDNFIGAFLSGIATIARTVLPTLLPVLGNALSTVVQSRIEGPKETAIVIRQPETREEKREDRSMLRAITEDVLMPVTTKAITTYTNPRTNEVVTVNKVDPRERTMQRNVFLQQGTSAVTNRRAAAGKKSRRARGDALLARAFDSNV